MWIESVQLMSVQLGPSCNAQLSKLGGRQTSEQIHGLGETTPVEWARGGGVMVRFPA